MNNKGTFSEYVKTFLITLVVAFVIVILMLFWAQFQAYNLVLKQDTPEKNVNPYLVNLLIDKNKYLANQNPKDYKLNIKLGLLYEYCGDYKNAESQYKQAIYKTNFNDYTAYKNLALLYVKENKLDEASNVMDKIDERPYNPLIVTKGYIYAIIADSYYNRGDYDDAIDYYQRSLMYYKIINAPEVKLVNDSLASAYVYAAEQSVASLDYSDAISALQEADKIENAPIVKYKLALLLMNSNKKDAYKYFQKVFDTEPSIINFDIYHNFILQMADIADASGNTSLGDLYRFRAKKYEEYFDSHIITVDDINLQYIEGKITYNMFSRKYKINLQLKLRNISDRPLKSMYVIIKFENEDGTPICNYVQQIVDENSILGPSELTPIISIHSFDRKGLTDKSPKTVIANVYFAVSENSYKVHLVTMKICEHKVIKQGDKRIGEKPFSLSEFIKNIFKPKGKVKSVEKIKSHK